MKNKLFSIFAPFVLSITCAYGVDTFFFIAGDGGTNNANDRNQWVNLSTFNLSGDSFLFRLFPKGTDERVSLDKGNFRAGAINADQSSVITAESNVIFNRYCLGDLQPDGSVTFNDDDENIKNPNPIVFNGDFTVGNMFARINHYVDFQFAGAESITLTAKEINLSFISNAHFTKTTAGAVNIHVGKFIWDHGNNLYLGSSKGFIDSLYADTIDVAGNSSSVTFNLYVNKINCATTSFISDDGTKSATVNLHINKLSADGPIFYFGTTTKLDDSVINIDFTYADVEGLSAGEYEILFVDSWSKGFAEGGSLTDFNINDDHLNAMGIEHNFTWDGNSLVLNVVPEPADVAAFLGFAVLAFAFIRRRK